MHVTAFEVLLAEGSRSGQPLSYHLGCRRQNRSKESRGSTSSEWDMTQSCSVTGFSINKIMIYIFKKKWNFFFSPSGTLLILFIGYFKRICKYGVEKMCVLTQVEVNKTCLKHPLLQAEGAGSTHCSPSGSPGWTG